MKNKSNNINSVMILPPDPLVLQPHLPVPGHQNDLHGNLTGKEVINSFQAHMLQMHTPVAADPLPLSTTATTTTARTTAAKSTVITQSTSETSSSSSSSTTTTAAAIAATTITTTTTTTMAATTIET